MTDSEQAEFERELRQAKPARLSDNFNARLLVAKPGPAKVEPVTFIAQSSDCMRTLRLSLRWLIPATALVLAVTLAWQGSFPFASRPAGFHASVAAAQPLLKADDVKIDQRLVSSFDAVARLPGGEPVRFRCENWMDQVVLSDKSRGLVVENRKPRIEVLAMGFETY